jgi:type II secretory pathway pseudopilin PulG
MRRKHRFIKWFQACTHTRLHSCTPTRLHALTLIELVIVCAIIAVLVGIVWVVMAPAREKARQAVCISNLTQIGHAFRMYRDDWDGVEPQKGVQLEYWELGLPPDKGIPSLDKYLKSRDVWICPSSVLKPWMKGEPSGYYTNYCSHADAEGYDPYLPGGRFKYDECYLIMAGVKSFKWVVSYIPDWPIVICESHHYFYFPRDEFKDRFCIGVTLNDFTVRKFHYSDYAFKLPRDW